MHQINRRQALITMGVVLAVAGCGSDEPEKKADDLSAKRDGAMAAFAVGTQFKATVPVSFSVLYNNHSFYPIKNDWLFLVGTRQADQHDARAERGAAQ